uniref:Uncharacterized protein n=1 Tax=Anguilla anguilla TaxID=7936 RepID=A0A0E9QAZ3_ANGAN
MASKHTTLEYPESHNTLSLATGKMCGFALVSLGEMQQI